MDSLEYLSLIGIADKLPLEIPYLKMLVLFGSRARGDNRENSDWDFAVLYDEELRKPILKENAWRWLEGIHILGDMFGLNDDNLNLVELNDCSRLISHYVARDGKLIYEKDPGEFVDFQQNYLMSNTELKQIYRELREELELSLQRRSV